jgi:hypothetical protein
MVKMSQILDGSVTLKAGDKILNDGVFDTLNFGKDIDGWYIYLVSADYKMIKIKGLSQLFHDCGCRLTAPIVIGVAGEDINIKIKDV